MYKSEFAIYLGEEKDEGFSGFISQDNFFAVLQIEKGISKEKGRQCLQEIAQGFKTTEINDLSQFELIISQKLQEVNIPSHFSLSALCLHKDIIYLKTIGEGEIFGRRGKEFGKIISKDNSASGYLSDKDMFILTSETFTILFEDKKDLKEFMDGKKPSEIVEDLTPELKGKKDIESIALFVRWNKEKGTDESSESLKEVEDKSPYSENIFSKKQKVSQFIRKVKGSLYKRGKEDREKKFYTFVVVLILLLILIWSVGLGYKRRQRAKILDQIKITRQEIKTKLQQADEESFFNIDQSRTLISDAKKEVSLLRKKVGDSQKLEINELEKLITKKENQILKKETHKFTEFYDLKIISQKAKGEKMFLSDNQLVILDSRGVVYNLSLEKKSIEKKEDIQIKNTDLIAYIDKNYYLFNPQEGVYRLGNNNKVKKVIDLDDQWGEIIDINVYRKNLYLLDKTNDEIYKYLPVENGFASKKSYFKSGQAIDLSTANSIAIDASVYIGLENNIKKYTSGVRDKFDVSFPNSNLTLKKIYTDNNLKKVYGWDKRNGLIYIIGKTGDYERQIVSSILKKGDDFVVYQNGAYILVKNKIYKIKMD